MCAIPSFTDADPDCVFEKGRKNEIKVEEIKREQREEDKKKNKKKNLHTKERERQTAIAETNTG